MADQASDETLLQQANPSPIPPQATTRPIDHHAKIPGVSSSEMTPATQATLISPTQAATLITPTKAGAQTSPSQAATLVSPTQSAPEYQAPSAPAGLDGIQRLGNYKLLQKLGEGAMGAVFLAEDAAARGKVALKVLPKKFASDPEFVSRFRREAKVAFKLNHVNIATAFSVGEENGTHFYVMEYCQGESLDRILKRDRSMPCAKALEITIQVARGLKHAHEHSFIHRDIKPANILLGKDGVVKILDLGLSKNTSDSEQSFYTQTGVTLGTPHYISPEQAQGEKHLDGRSDIYSLGATFYHLLTGATPYQGTTAAAVILKHMTAPPPNPRELTLAVPNEVAKVIQKMMAKSAAHRYANCGDLLSDLEAILKGAPPAIALDAPAPLSSSTHAAGSAPQGFATAQTTRPGTVPAPPTNKKGGAGGSRLAPIGLGVGAALIALALFFYLSNKDPEVAAPQQANNPQPTPSAAAPKHQGPLAAARQALQHHAQAPDALATPSAPAGDARPASLPDPAPGKEAPATLAAPKPSAGVSAAKVETKEDYLNSFAGLEPAEQLRKALDKLKQVNPGWEIQERHMLSDGSVSELTLMGKALAEVWPVQGLAGLHSLNLSNSGISSLHSISGLPIWNLDFSYTAVSDLAPLAKNTSLERLNCSSSRVADLSPLSGTGLKHILCDFKADRDTVALKEIKSLLTINGMAVAEFWRSQEPKRSDTNQTNTNNTGPTTAGNPRYPPPDAGAPPPPQRPGMQPPPSGTSDSGGQPSGPVPPRPPMRPRR